MNIFIDVRNSLNLEELKTKFAVGETINSFFDEMVDYDATVYFYFRDANNPGIYAIGKVEDCIMYDLYEGVVKTKIVRCEDYPIVKQEDLQVNENSLTFRRLKPNELLKIEQQIGNFAKYADYNMLTFEEASRIIGVPYITINNWYLGKKYSPNSKCSKLLPDYYIPEGRRKKYIPKESIERLLAYKEIERKYGYSTSSKDGNYISIIEDVLKSHNIEKSVIDEILFLISIEA